MINLGFRYIDALADSLFRDGMRIIEAAKNTNETEQRTGNMNDAFGCAVFYNGKIIRRGYANPTPVSEEEHKGWEKHGIPANTGRGYLDEYFDSYKPSSDGMFLLCVNAVYYTPILEDGSQGGYITRKYRIISQTNANFNRLEGKYRTFKPKVFDLRKK